MKNLTDRLAKITRKHRKTKTENTKSQIRRRGRLLSLKTPCVNHVSFLWTPLQQVAVRNHRSQHGRRNVAHTRGCPRRRSLARASHTSGTEVRWGRGLRCQNWRRPANTIEGCVSCWLWRINTNLTSTLNGRWRKKKVPLVIADDMPVLLLNALLFEKIE
jgi:hypothetical protein